MSKKKQSGNGGSNKLNKLFEYMEIDIDDIVPNEWNVNEMKQDMFNRLVKEIKEIGFIEPIQVVKIDNDKYRIIGGEHRYHACKYLGYDKIPCIVLLGDRFVGEDVQKFISVRLNVIKGKINPEKFVKLYDEFVDKYGAENVQELLGIVDSNEYNKLLKQIGRGLIESGMSKESVKEFENKSSDIKNLDEIGNLINDIMIKYGNTLENDFIVFNYGGKNIYWFKIDKKCKKTLDFICKQAVDDKEKIGRYIQEIFEFYFDNFLKDKVKKDD